MKQPVLPKFKSATYLRPMMSVETVRGVLDMTTDEVVSFMEFGNLWAWNVASPATDESPAPAPCYRFLTRSVSAWTRETAREQLEDTDSAPVVTPATAEEAIADLLSRLPSPVSTENRPWITGPELRRLLNVERTHLLDLVRERVFTQLPGTQFRKGPGDYPLIQPASVEKFLKQRLA